MITQPVATLLAAFCALLGVVGGWLASGLVQARIERSRARNAREDALVRESSTALQNFALNAARILHSMCWLTWLASYDPDKLKASELTRYNEEAHTALPNILGYLTTLSALDTELYRAMREFADNLYELDAEIGLACVLFATNRTQATADLVSAYQRSVDLEHGLPDTIAGLITSRFRTGAA